MAIRRVGFLFALFSGLIPALAPPASAAAGAAGAAGLDASFGEAGLFRLDFTKPSVDVANAATASDIGPVAAGSAGGQFALAAFAGGITFNNGRDKVIVDFGQPSAAHAIVVRHTQLVAAGSAGEDFALASYGLNGDADVGFGDMGRVRTSFGAPAVAYGLTALDAFTVLAAGRAGTSMAMAVYDRNGDLLPSFGTGGKVVADLTPGSDTAYAAGTFTSPFGTQSIFVAGQAGGAAFVARYHANGEPDLTFGSQGRLLLDLTSGDDVARALSVTPTGQVVVAGSAGAEGFVARITAAGALDPAFTAAGVVRTTLGGTAARLRYAGADWDGKVLVAGTVTRASGDDGVAARFNADGSPDSGFGSGGRTVVDFGTAADQVNAATGQHPNGNSIVALIGGDGADIVAAHVNEVDGSASNGAGDFDVRRVDFGAPDEEWASAVKVLPDNRVLAAGWGTRGVILARLLPDGSPDPTFGAGGYSVTPFAVRTERIEVAGDHIYVLGEHTSSFSGVMRFSANGELDLSYGAGGWAETRLSQANFMAVAPGGGAVVVSPAPSWSTSRSVQIAILSPGGEIAARTAAGQNTYPVGAAAQPDGKFVVVSRHPESGVGAQMARYNADGTIDTTFLDGDRLTGYPVRLDPRALLRLADGRYFILGQTSPTPEDPARDLLVVVFTTTGMLDDTFGAGGVRRIPAPDLDKIVGIGQLADGRIVAVDTPNTFEEVGAILRFLPSGQLDDGFGTGGRATYAGIKAEGAAVSADGKVLLAGWALPSIDITVARALVPDTDAPAPFHPLTPVRLLDTRDGQGNLGGSMLPGPGWTLPLQVGGRGGVPATGAASVVLNVTVTQPTNESFLTVWPTGWPRPLASNLNFQPGQTVPNLVVVKLGAGGMVNLYIHTGTAEIVVDLAGWYGAGGESFSPLTPARLLDTRTGNGAPAAKVGPGSAISLQVTGRGGVPAAGVSAVVLNVTVTEPTATSFLTVWPAGETLPLASNLNFVAGDTAPNLVMVKVGEGGKVNLYNNSGSVHVIADVAGWYGTAGGLYTSVVPSRILDTRTGTGAAASKLGPGSALALQITGRGGVPSTGVSAVILNVTVTEPTELSFLTAWPAGEARPLASNLNYRSSQTVPNLVTVKVGAGGKVNLYNLSGSVHVIADVAGWYGT